MNTAEVVKMVYDQINQSQSDTTYWGHFGIGNDGESFIFIDKNNIVANLFPKLFTDVYNLAAVKIKGFEKFDLVSSIHLIDSLDVGIEEIPNSRYSVDFILSNFKIYKLDANMTKLIKLTPISDMLHQLCNEQGYLIRVNEIFDRINKEKENNGNIKKEDENMETASSNTDFREAIRDILGIEEEPKTVEKINTEKENNEINLNSNKEEKQMEMEEIIQRIDEIKWMPSKVDELVRLQNLKKEMEKNLEDDGTDKEEFSNQKPEEVKAEEKKEEPSKQEAKEVVKEEVKVEVKDTPKKVQVVLPSIKGATQALFGTNNNTNTNVANFTQQAQLPPQSQQQSVIPRELRFLNNFIDFDSFDVIVNPVYAQSARNMINALNREVVGYREDTKETFYTLAFNKVMDMVRLNGRLTFNNIFIDPGMIVFACPNGNFVGMRFTKNGSGVYMNLLQAPAQLPGHLAMQIVDKL